MRAGVEGKPERLAERCQGPLGRVGFGCLQRAVMDLGGRCAMSLAGAVSIPNDDAALSVRTVILTLAE